MTFRPARAGAYRCPMSVVLNASTTLDSLGNAVEVGSTVMSIRASIEQLSGDEQQLVRQTYPTATHTIETHYTANITNRCWLMYGARRFNIENVNDTDERKRVLTITATEER